MLRDEPQKPVSSDDLVQKTDQALFSEDDQEFHAPASLEIKNNSKSQSTLNLQQQERLEKAKKLNNRSKRKKEGNEDHQKNSSGMFPASNKKRNNNEPLKLDDTKSSKIKTAKDRLKKALKNESGSADGNDKNSNPIASLKAKDPRSMVGGTLDEYLKMGRAIAFWLTYIWVVITILLTLCFFIPGIIGIIMLALLLIKPQWNYRITVWLLEGILDFVGVGEVMTFINQFGFTKIKIKLNFLEKFIIIFIILLYFFGALMITAFIMSITCWSIGGWGGTVASWLDQSGFISSLKSVCPAKIT